MKDCHTRARALPPPPAGPGRGRARGRSDLGPNIPFKRLRILPGAPAAEIHLHGCAGDQIFGERLRDCSRDLFVQLLRSQLAVRRLPELTRAAVLLPGDRSRDCTAYIFLHRLRTATSNKHTRCLV